MKKPEGRIMLLVKEQPDGKIRVEPGEGYSDFGRTLIALLSLINAERHGEEDARLARQLRRNIEEDLGVTVKPPEYVGWD